MVFYFFFEIIFAVLCGTMAASKNRNVGIWVILGFLFGIFAFLILLFLRKIEGDESTIDRGGSHLAEELGRWKKLLDDGAIDKAEFDKEKQRILGVNGNIERGQTGETK